MLTSHSKSWKQHSQRLNYCNCPTPRRCEPTPLHIQMARSITAQTDLARGLALAFCRDPASPLLGINKPLTIPQMIYPQVARTSSWPFVWWSPICYMGFHKGRRSDPIVVVIIKNNICTLVWNLIGYKFGLEGSGAWRFCGSSYFFLNLGWLVVECRHNWGMTLVDDIS